MFPSHPSSGFVESIWGVSGGGIQSIIELDFAMRLLKKPFALLSVIIFCAGLTGCASNSWHADTSPYPTTTPFDADPLARQAFLDGFNQGYRAQGGSAVANVDMMAGAYSDARRQGYYAGSAKATAEREQQKPK